MKRTTYIKPQVEEIELEELMEVNGGAVVASPAGQGNASGAAAKGHDSFFDEEY